MKYESTILKRLIDTYGVVGNPHYISEIIKEFIVQGKECYPDLFTYQSDWLAHIDEFGLNPSYTVSYTGQHIYAPNTKEKPVKRAILKGQTLVNIPTITDTIGILNANFVQRIKDVNLLKPSTKYLLKIFNKSTEDKKYTTHPAIWVYQSTPVKANSSATYIIQTNTDVSSGSCLLRNGSDHTQNNNLDVLLIEYQDGMENWDIPYFEGVQSVKLPVLKVTGKNLFDSNNRVVKAENTYGYIDFTDYDGKLTFSIRDKDTSIDMSGIFFGATYQGRDYNETNTNNGGWLFANGEFKMSSLTTSKCKYFSFHPNSNSTLDKIIARYDIQVEESSQPTSYEPYKSNILTTSEDVVLRSNGSVCDELDLLTGKLTQRIDEDGEILTQEVVKTVDLTILDQNGQNVKQLMSFNGGTHFTTSSQEGSPLPMVSVSVETDLEETLKICSLEGNTL